MLLLLPRLDEYGTEMTRSNEKGSAEDLHAGEEISDLELRGFG